MNLHARTLSTIRQLDQVEWFTRVGVNDTNNAIVLSSWEEATRSCESSDWEDLLLEAANQYCERLMERSPERFNQWNEIVGEVRPVIIPFVEKKTAKAIRTHQLPSIFLQTVQWDVLHICMEAEYADVYPPGFYAAQGFWYTKDHFPCGWEGVFPDGKLIIY